MTTIFTSRALLAIVLGLCLVHSLHGQQDETVTETTTVTTTETTTETTTPTEDPCANNPCGAAEYCHVPSAGEEGGHETSTNASYICIENGYRPGSCSLHAYMSCDEYAQCSDSEDFQSFICQCQENAVGDGFKPDVGGTGCKLSFKPCSTDVECPQYGSCDPTNFKCVCNDGFEGDGYNCTDINECPSPLCSPFALCSNFPGGFTCTCDASNNYVGDGYECRLICYNDNDCDVPRAQCNDNQTCECTDGYQGDGITCLDVDECSDENLNDCSVHSTCVNTQGSYECQCNNGYTGDGFTCEALPKSCEEIGDFVPGKQYVIDPDFTGPANSFTVTCDYIRGVVVTKVVPVGTFPLGAPAGDTPVDIDYEPEPTDIQPLLEISGFCYQDISFACYPGFKMFPGTEWYDAYGNANKNFGSTEDEQCACGELGLCANSCYCDGTQSSSLTTDSGRVADKSRLPVVSIKFAASAGEKGRVDIGPLMCAPTTVDVPKDCNQAKFEFGITQNTPLLIDPDGQGGEDPFLVFCDQESFDHVGITEIPTQNPTVVVTTEEGETIDYNVNLPKIQALISGSLYCSQQVEFVCKNSKLMAGGGFVSVTGSQRRLDYFPGANGVQGACGCGATQSCAAPEVKCNCDIEDGVERKDFGLIIDKSDLPVVKVTAEIGETRSATYTLGPLKCSQKQFGIEPNCEKYRATGVNESYSYPIDPDGPGGLDPFIVECKFIQSPPQGQTIVHHENEGPQNILNALQLIRYLLASKDQIDALQSRSTICTQEVTLECQKLNIKTTPEGAIKWLSGETDEYELAAALETCGDNGCNCNGVGQGTDSGTLSNMTSLPVYQMDYTDLLGQLTSGGELSVTLGPLVCSEVFPTCALLKEFIDSGSSVEGEAVVIDGFFTIDPDGAGGVPPFEVRCQFPSTIITIGPPTDGITTDPGDEDPVSICYDIGYKNEHGDPISAEQITALVQASGKCVQDLTLECQNAPASGMVNFTSCDGKAQPGWAGSFGEDSCACGVNGNCDGGPDAKCNCDVADGQLRSDKGSIIETDRLPVCQICLTIDPPAPEPNAPNPPPSMLQYKLGELKCDAGQGTRPTCQQARRIEGSQVTQQTEISVAIDSDTPTPVGCRYFPDPPIGILIVKPKNPITPPTDEGPTEVNIIYITINITIIRDILQDNEYCKQNVFLFCATDENLALGGNYGWYSFDGQVSYDWTELAETSQEVKTACEENEALCQQCGLPKGFRISKKEDLPVAKLLLAGAGVTVVVDAVQCLDLKKSCQEILDTNSQWRGYISGRTYAIDPDGSGDIQPFIVNCEFDKPNGNGVTEIPVSGDFIASVTVSGQTQPANFYLPVEYKGATPEQINAVTQISDFCWQGVKYECRYSPLVGKSVPPSTFYTTYNGGNSSSFGTGSDSDFPGCACGQTGTCMSGFTCNCDTDNLRMGVDQGAVTDKDALPITGMYVGGQAGPSSMAMIQFTNVRCSSKPIDPPRDCADALARGSQYGVDYAYNSEYLISPDPENGVEPFMVRCDFHRSPGNGVTVIKTKWPKDKPLEPKPGEPTDIPYYGPSEEQLVALIQQSAYCYQGVKFDCFASTLFLEGSYWLGGGSREKRMFWGGGSVSETRGGLCACGEARACGGLDSNQGQRNRRCNCDVGDERFRSDAGIIDIKSTLPVTQFWLGRTARFQAVNMTFGDLYCSQTPLAFNECELDFHDCHPLATCVDEADGYRCVCPPGWNGKGVVLTSSDARANGRECIDDNECVAQNPCPYSATCTNIPGDFFCTCKPGYLQTGKTTCVDINECSDDTLNDCDENARCENLDGSYRCVCNRGYRGDGRICIPVGECLCFGDPHCITYDNKWLHFQGDCQYVMSQDGCQPGETRTFRVLVEHWQKDNGRPGYYTWIKTVTVQIFGRDIRLEQEGRILVDGIEYKQYYDQHRLTIIHSQNKIRLRAVTGLIVLWDGKDVVEITVPRDAKNSTCGLCGDYNGNKADDFEQGPACPANEGQLTDNEFIFGRSWTRLDSECEVDCSTPPPEPPEEECFLPRAIVESECDKLMSLENSPFKKCLQLKTPEALVEFRESCEFDLCHNQGDLEASICRYAEIMSFECADNEKVEITDWKSKVDACEEMKCTNNMIYMACGPASPRTCLSDSVQEDLDVPVCNEGCFCPENQVMEGDKCIKPEECGCHYGNGYMETGDIIFLPDCSARLVCQGTNQTEELPLDCGENEECRTEDGVTGCYCVEGYIMGDNEQCEPDTCLGVECPITNMECDNGTCVCMMGYIGDCNQCEDVDECATGEAECNRIGQACVNTEGSFTCICEDGFIGNGERCDDIDECEYGIDNCGANAECVNSLGSFRCECCAGYKMNAQGECVRDQSAGSTGQKCCACQGEKCVEPGKVCGTDGTTYANYRSLAVTGCKNGDDSLKVNYNGACQGTCDSVVCDKQYSTCEMKDGKPTCACPTCSDSVSEYEDNTVCATNKVTYTSICHMKAATCEAEIETTVEVETIGSPCPGKGGIPVVGPWSEWGPCSEDCKQGVRNRTREVYVEDTPGYDLHDTESIPCYSTCDQGPCTQSTCNTSGQVCVADENNAPSCQCPVCTDFPEELVCGRVGNVVQTYPNECELQYAACEQGEADFELLEPRACEDKPKECGLIRHYRIEEDENGCRADRSINFGECYGGCDEEAELCCYGNEVEQRVATMYCPDGSSFTKFFEVTVGCNCITKEDVDALKMQLVEG